MHCESDFAFFHCLCFESLYFLSTACHKYADLSLYLCTQKKCISGVFKILKSELCFTCLNHDTTEVLKKEGNGGQKYHKGSITSSEV